MSGENTNEKPKLVFDVMPETEGVSSVKPITRVARSEDPASRPVRKNRGEPPESQITVPAPKQTLGDSNVSTKPHSNKRLLISVAAAIVVGLLGYLTYSLFMPQSPAIDPVVVTPDIQEMDSGWMIKHFGTATCEDDLFCGPNADLDGDGLKNLKESESLTDPNNPDTDYDGISDIDELRIYSTDPIIADTDGDKFEDGIEVRNGYSPNYDSDQKISSLEQQVIDENIESYGLSELTETFLRMKPYTSVFSGTDQQIYLSAPNDWVATSTDSQLLFSSLEDIRFSVRVASTQASTTEDLREIILQDIRRDSGFESLSSKNEMIGGISYLVDEFRYALKDNLLFVKQGIFEKDGIFYHYNISLPDIIRIKNEQTIDLLSRQIRFWPFE